MVCFNNVFVGCLTRVVCCVVFAARVCLAAGIVFLNVMTVKSTGGLPGTPTGNPQVCTWVLIHCAAFFLSHVLP